MSVSSKKIGVIDSDLLRDALGEHHEAHHTPDGLARFNGPRRQLVEIGRKGIAIAAELVRRGSIPTPCRYCLPDRHLGEPR